MSYVVKRNSLVYVIAWLFAKMFQPWTKTGKYDAEAMIPKSLCLLPWTAIAQALLVIVGWSGIIAFHAGAVLGAAGVLTFVFYNLVNWTLDFNIFWEPLHYFFTNFVPLSEHWLHFVSDSVETTTVFGVVVGLIASIPVVAGLLGYFAVGCLSFVFACLALAAGVVGLVEEAKDRLPSKISSKLESTKQGSLVAEWVRAKKNKVCPTVEVDLK